MLSGSPDLNCKRVKLDSKEQHCLECLEKDERIKSLEMQVNSQDERNTNLETLVESLTRYVCQSLCFREFEQHSTF